MRLPKEFQGWVLVPINVLLGFWTEAGTINVNGRTWRLGRSEQSLDVFLLTDLPHPDRKPGEIAFAVYRRDLKPDFQNLCGELASLMEPEEDTDA